MKPTKIFSLSLMIIFMISCRRNIQEIPENIVSRFEQQYPNANEVTWQEEQEKYEVKFTEDGNYMEIIYDREGNIIEEARRIVTDEIPGNISNSVAEQYPDYEIIDVEEVTRQGEDFYNVEIEGAGQVVELLFSGDGEYIESKPMD